MFKPIAIAVSVASVALVGAYAGGIYMTKSQYNTQIEKFLASPSVNDQVVIKREVIDNGFFSQVERFEIKANKELNLDASLFYENRVSFSVFDLSGEFHLDTKRGLLGKLITDRVVSGLEHTGKWTWDDKVEVSHKTSSFSVDTDTVDASVSPVEHAFYIDLDKGNGEYQLKFGGVLLVEQDRNRVQIGTTRSDGFVQISESGKVTFPQQNTSIANVDARFDGDTVRLDDVLLNIQELEDKGFVTINQDFSVGKIQSLTKKGNHEATNLRVKASLRHLDRAGYDLIRASVDSDNPKDKLRMLEQGAQMISEKGFALDINDFSVGIDGGRSGMSGTLSLKPVDLRDIKQPQQIITHMGGDLALTIDSKLVNLDPKLNNLVRQGIAAGFLKLDKDGNPAMFAELNSGRLLVNGKPMM